MLPKIVDLFSGCGGLALGFQKAGYDICTGVELMSEACSTLEYNLNWKNGKEENHLCGDITQLDPSIFDKYVGSNDCVVIGGPPCQAYSLAGRAKLRSLGEHRVNTQDKRGYLYQDFLRVILHLRAKAVVMENVPESTDYGGKCIPEEVSDTLESNGYSVKWTILNSADYGVPQIRERVILVAVKIPHVEIAFPVPTHKGPEGYKTNHQRRMSSYSVFSHFVEPPSNQGASKKWVTVEDAFSDLPVLFPNSRVRYKLAPMNLMKSYRTGIENDFQRQMRSWFGDECNGVSSNCFRNNARDFAIFEEMQCGETYSAAVNIAHRMVVKEADAFGVEKGSEKFKCLEAKILPGMNQNSFENKWRRLDPQKPSYTLVAHLSKDTYSHIHPWEPRGISVREAARLQSFPDEFIFKCSMGDAFKQIGNAVPPLLAYNVALALRKTMGEYNVY